MCRQLSGRLEYSPNVNDAPSRCFGRSSAALFATGPAPKSMATILGTFDPTRRLPEMVLTHLRWLDGNKPVTNNPWQIASPLQVARNYEGGVFAARLQTIWTVPVGPAYQMRRSSESYNSLDRARSGDFGNGWSLALSNHSFAEKSRSWVNRGRRDCTTWRIFPCVLLGSPDKPTKVVSIHVPRNGKVL